MPRRNRVTPFGEIIATPSRGTIMGNRGRLHDADGLIRRTWQVKRWILCRLEFNGRRRTIMAPNRYTELFFLDEATGLAAGHRPCFECRRDSFHAFRKSWSIGNRETTRLLAAGIDERLHRERLSEDGGKTTFGANLDELPDGVFVMLRSEHGGPWLIWGDTMLAWSLEGYTERRARPVGESATVLTPRSTVAAIRAGYAPEVHPSALNLEA
jgi:hypothetical protein